jgi:DNA invertase Pin-like site-specific DNA recombinase
MQAVPAATMNMAVPEGTTPARAAIYARVSTNEQSTELQLRDLRQYATARGLTVTEYVDTGFSGAKQSRPALDRLMDESRKRRFDCVLVWRFDRFARSTKHLLLALEEFRSLGVQFISYQENIDTTSPLRQTLFTIVSAVAQLERDLLRERVRAGLRNARAKGKRFGRPRAEVDALRVAALRSEGLSWSQVCQRLKLSKGTAQRAFYSLPNCPDESVPASS